MSEHAPTTRDDAGDRSGQPAARAPLANEEIETLLGHGSRGVNKTAENSQQFLQQTEEAIAALAKAGRQNMLPTAARSFSFKEFGTDSAGVELAGLTVDGDAQLELRVELGRTYMHLDDVRRLRHGSVVSFDSLADEPVAIYVNNRLVARGELLVMNGRFCIRVLELVAATLAKAG